VPSIDRGPGDVHADGRARVRPPDRNYVKVTREHIAMPRRGCAGTPDGCGPSPYQKILLFHLLERTWWGEHVCTLSNLKIADATGRTGKVGSRRDAVKHALYGRTYKAGRTDRESGKYTRDGATVTSPGLIDMGFVEVRQVGDARELLLTRLFLEWGRFRVFDDGGGPPARCDRPAAPPRAEAPVLPGLALVVGQAAPAVAPAVAPPIAEAPAVAPAEPAPAVPPIVEEPAPPIAEAPAVAGPAPAASPVLDQPDPPAPAERPAPEVLEEVLGRYATFPRPAQAEHLLGLLNRRQIRFRSEDGGAFRQVRFPGCGELTDPETAVIRWLKPEVLAALNPAAEKPRAVPEAGGASASRKPAPPVACAAEFRATVGRLTAQPAADDSDCRAVARLLVSDPGFRHNDRDPALTAETMTGLALDTKNRVLPEAVLLGAFEEACKPGKVNRGSAMVAAVKRAKSSLRRPNREGGWS